MLTSKNGDWPSGLITVDVRAEGLPGTYRAQLRLAAPMFETFDQGIEPVFDRQEINRLLADLASIGDEAAQLAKLGWAVHWPGEGMLRFVMDHGDHREDQWIVADENRFTLPRFARWEVEQLPPLATLFVHGQRKDALYGGPSDQLTDDEDNITEAAKAARALGELFGSLIAATVAEVSEDSEHQAATALATAFAAGLADGGLPGDGPVINRADLAARAAGYDVTVGERYMVVTMTEADFDALRIALLLTPGQLGRWKGTYDGEQREITLGPELFSLGGVEEYEQALAFVQARGLRYSENREIHHQLDAAQAARSGQ